MTDNRQRVRDNGLERDSSGEARSDILQIENEPIGNSRKIRRPAPTPWKIQHPNDRGPNRVTDRHR
ncbi:MAG: hypothetical protein J7642_19645 [Cyanobacteria bacterium SBC]|nr:hypothetical protein [Cyanobacteria bacterium SBC]